MQDAQVLGPLEEVDPLAAEMTRAVNSVVEGETVERARFEPEGLDIEALDTAVPEIAVPEIVEPDILGRGIAVAEFVRERGAGPLRGARIAVAIFASLVAEQETAERVVAEVQAVAFEAANKWHPNADEKSAVEAQQLLVEAGGLTLAAQQGQIDGIDFAAL